jgi:5-methylcytosine-specific restriction endonuclease McrA
MGSEHRTKLLHILGIQCSVCGITDIKSLQIDHRYEDGSYDRRFRFKSDYAMYKYYLKNPDEARQRLQVLCANCNVRLWIKRDRYISDMHIFVG